MNGQTFIPLSASVVMETTFRDTNQGQEKKLALLLTRNRWRADLLRRTDRADPGSAWLSGQIQDPGPAPGSWICSDGFRAPRLWCAAAAALSWKLSKCSLEKFPLPLLWSDLHVTVATGSFSLRLQAETFNSGQIKDLNLWNTHISCFLRFDLFFLQFFFVQKLLFSAQVWLTAVTMATGSMWFPISDNLPLVCRNFSLLNQFSSRREQLSVTADRLEIPGRFRS